ncbi:WD40 containing snare-dependent exocytosis protein [Mycena alexandri]|uniref:WD40 containing snare-dependent exocytosis protein n=1 Tax=Mycena alexandri TaxID=1745969 RepID=A0AAD6T8H1_9AGAR|nr:WD40 containing snare-dependent exocytosis protein [Mycena alexandri]
MFKQDRTVFKDLSADLRDETDYKVATLKSFEYPLNITAVAVEPLAGLLAVGTATGTIHIFGGVSVEVKLLLPESVKVKFLQFSSSTFQIVCLDERSQLLVWDLSPVGRPKLVASAKFDHATALTLSPSHSHAFIALESGEMRTYDLLCLRKSEYRMPNMWHLYEEKTMATRMNPVSAPPFPVETVVHPRDLNLLFVAYSGGIILSDLTQRNTLRAYEFVLPAGAPGGPGYGHPDILTHRRPEVTAIAIHPAGHFFAAGYSDGCIAFWAIEDEDQPIFVRTLDEINVHLVDVDELEKTRDAPPPEREPIYKLAWSSFPNSSDPRGGQTALTILGGLVMAPGEATGLNVQWLPAFNPSEPPNPAAATQTGLHPFMRSAMQVSLLPISDFFYYTPGIAQDFFLVPRSSPHFSGHYDPSAILISVESVGDARVIEAHQFPPPAFLASPEPVVEADDPSGSVVDDLASTLKSMALNDDPHVLRPPTALWFGSTGVFQTQLLTLDRESHELLVAGEDAYPFSLTLKGGAAWSDESKLREIRLAKFQMPRILLTRHRNLATAVQFHDISAQLLITSDAPIANHFPKSLPGLTIDLGTLLTDASVIKKTSPTMNHAVLQSAYLARQSLECVIQLASGEIIVYRLKTGSENPPRSPEVQDDEIVLLDHVFTSEGSRFAPYFLLTTGKPVSACAISDIGFLAVAYSDSLVVVDMRGPRVILRHGRDKKKDRMSLHLHSADSVHIASLTWTVATLENDPQLRIRLIIGHASGAAEILTIIRDTNSPAWRTDSHIHKIETVSHPLTQGTFVLDPKNGHSLRATKEQLAQSFQPTPPETHCILVTAGVKGARCFADITGSRIGKTDWGNKTGTVLSVQIIEKMGSHALLAFTDNHEVLAYSLPTLDYICTLQLPVEDASHSCDETGDWIGYTVNNASGIIDHASYGTVLDFRRAYDPPDIDFSATKPTVPSQPQPVSLGPTSLLSSWFRFGQSMTGPQLDVLLGGPDRPIPVPETKPKSTATPADASSIAQTAAGVQSSLYSRLQSAMGERGQMLGDLEDRFNSLEEGSKSMVSQAKRLAAEQSAKSWFGI